MDRSQSARRGFLSRDRLYNGTIFIGECRLLCYLYKIKRGNVFKSKTAILCLSVILPFITTALSAQNYGTSTPSAASLSCDGKGGAPRNVASYAPMFSWVFQDADPGDAQTAYAIRVGSIPGAGDAWDSGKIVSATGARMYAGAPLAPNATYFWSVRVWDRADQPSLEAQASFEVLDVGLRVFDGTSVIKIAADDNLSASALRIRKGSATYGIVLANPGDYGASNIRIATTAGVKALKKMTAPQPAIGLSAGNLAFAGVDGGASPSAKTVSVSNAGGGVLSGLSASIGYGSGSGWLAASLDSTTAPATLTVTPATESLPAGAYTAVVTVSSLSAANGPQAVNVSLAISEQTGSPSFFPPGGSYTGAQTVTLVPPASRMSIRYTTDGSTPSATHGILYVGPFPVAVSQTIQAVAITKIQTTSPVSTASYSISYASPTIASAAAGSRRVTVTWGQVIGAVSYNLYWLQGSTVTPSDGVRVEGASSPLTVSGLANDAQYAFIVTAVNGSGESAPSPVATATPYIQWGVVGAPAFSAGTAEWLSLVVLPGVEPPGADRGGGFPCLAYADGANGNRLTVMNYDGAAWAPLGAPGFSAGQVSSVSLATGEVPVGGGSATWYYAAYQDYANGQRATVMANDGSGWATLGSPGFSAGQANFISLAADTQGIPYVAYQDAGNGNRVTVMRLVGGIWSVVGAPGFSPGTAELISLAMNGDTPYVAFKDDGNNEETTVMRFAGGVWSFVGSPGFSSSGGGLNGVQLRIGPGGVPFVMSTMGLASPGGPYNDETVARFDGTDWVNVTTVRVNWPGSFALDAAGNFYVAYQDMDIYGEIGFMRQVSVLMYDGTSWEPLGSRNFSAGPGAFIVIAMDTTGDVPTPVVAYEDIGNWNRATVMEFQ